MILRFLLKIWPALAVIFAYLFWVFVIERIILKKLRKAKVIDGEFIEINDNSSKAGPFSLKNRGFLFTIYLSLITLIISFLLLAVGTSNAPHGKYIPAEIKEGKIIPGKIVE
jgi:hypothetical protein